MGLRSSEFGYATTDPTSFELSSRIEVYVLFTGIPSTLGALRTAAQLSQGLGCRIRLLLLEAVPYPLPLNEPRRSPRFLSRQFRTVVDSCSVETATRSVETVAEIVLCRDAWDGLRQRLHPGSVVVIGKRRQWWPCFEDRLARKLRASGHHVVRTSAPARFGLDHLFVKGLSHA